MTASSACRTIQHGHDARQRLAGVDGSQVFVRLLTMDQARHIQAQFGKLLDEAPVLPEEEDGRGCGRQWNVLVSLRLSSLLILIDRIGVADGKRQFAQFYRLDMRREGWKAISYLAGIKHALSLFLLYAPELFPRVCLLRIATAG